MAAFNQAEPPRNKAEAHKLVNDHFAAAAWSASQGTRVEQIRQIGKALAHAIIDLVPGSTERDNAIHRLDEALFWAGRGIVLNEPAPGLTIVGEQVKP